MSIWKAGLSMIDAYGRTTTPSFEVEAVDISEALFKMIAFVVDYEAICASRVTKHWIHLVSLVTDDVVTAGANKDEGATFRAELATPGKFATIKIKSPEKSIFNADGTVDLTNALFLAWAVHYTSGDFLASDGEIVDHIQSGKLDQ